MKIVVEQKHAVQLVYQKQEDVRLMQQIIMDQLLPASMNGNFQLVMRLFLVHQINSSVEQFAVLEIVMM